MALQPGGGWSFAEVVRHYVADFSIASGLPRSVARRGGGPPHANGQRVLRIVQEALANVRKHADATLVRSGAGGNRQGLELRVTDNGRGFATGPVLPAGMVCRAWSSAPPSSAAA